MPILGKQAEKKIILTDYKDEEAWVLIKTDLTAEDVLLSKNSKDQTEATFDSLARIIIDWNFTVEGGEKAPIDTNSVRKLKMTAVLQIQKEILEGMPQDVMDEAKKKVLSLSSPPTAPIV